MRTQAEYFNTNSYEKLLIGISTKPFKKRIIIYSLETYKPNIQQLDALQKIIIESHMIYTLLLRKTIVMIITDLHGWIFLYIFEHTIEYYMLKVETE